MLALIFKKRTHFFHTHTHTHTPALVRARIAICFEVAVGQFEDFTVKLKSGLEEKASSVEDTTTPVLEFSPVLARRKRWKREQISVIEEEDPSPFTNER